MKNAVLLLTLLAFSPLLFSQETFDPKVTRKSAKDTYINKIVLVDNYTVVSMKYVSKSLKEQLEEYIRNNPELKSQLEQLDSYARKMHMGQIAMELQKGSNTISFQSTSYLKSKDGRRFKFIKASSIPISPDNIATEPDKRYYFKVYFERLPPGIEEIDLIEGENQRADEPVTVTYWNFYGVQVNNPANPEETKKIGEESPVGQVPAAILPAEQNVQITLSGRVLDSQTDEPVAAKIVCVTKKSGVKYDSVVTSKSGLYEFVIPPDDYLYEITAPGYQLSEEAYDLANLNANGSFSRNFYLDPTPPQEQDASTPAESTNMPSSDPVQVNENTFRLDKVHFNSGEAVITPESFDQLDGIASMMQQDPNVKIQVVGHTDNQGDSRLNKRLSLQRAFNVREYLISQGIDGKRIKFSGVGGESPIAPNDTEENRQKNRRVEFIILDK